MVIFWEIAARSVSILFSLYFVYLVYLFISRFGFKSGICLLIAPVPVHCISVTFDIVYCQFLDVDVIRRPSYGVYISQLIRFARASSHVNDFNNRNKILNCQTP